MIYIIANRLAGKGKGAACIKAAEAVLQERGVQFKTLVSEYAGHSTILAKQACADIACRRIIAIGGDGTFSEVLNGLDLSVPIAFVPAGTGNDFAKGTNLPTDTKSAVLAAIDGKVALFDILTVNNKRCLNIAGTGFDVDVLLNEKKARKVLPGKLSYMAGLLTSLIKLRFFKAKLSVDDAPSAEKSLFLLAAANGRYYGGGLPVCLDAGCDDGYMDLLLVKELPYSAVPGALTKFLKGKIKEVDKYVEYCRCKKLTLHAEPALPINIDGELTDGMLPITIEVKHRCLQVCR